MTDSSLKLAVNAHTKRVQHAQPQAVDDDEYQAFNFGRVGSKAQLMIGFQRADQSESGFAYADLRRYSATDSDSSFELSFTEGKITIEGRNLKRILELIRQHRVTDLLEASHDQIMSLPEGEPVITKIRLTLATSASRIRSS